MGEHAAMPELDQKKSLSLSKDLKSELRIQLQRELTQKGLNFTKDLDKQVVSLVLTDNDNMELKKLLLSWQQKPNKKGISAMEWFFEMQAVQKDYLEKQIINQQGQSKDMAKSGFDHLFSSGVKHSEIGNQLSSLGTSFSSANGSGAYKEESDPKKKKRPRNRPN